ncbi:glycoside hydrolase family 3 N-terminal domain-containing protein [Paenibacillus guangzhouensis]|uniref:glycoside hydrolase family 3 N-terminal domain-containing protein n=1 Tax=Paenibacillus guangzhouensis TaxID=1473112 RepID=UPI001266CC2B|nr:glycoside hydrolase family 3 N-terminal domain-containing protein [Paenibacillus guangzhouensis]
MKFLDASCSIDERTVDLLERMTLEEKIGQLVQPFGWQAYERAEDKIQLTDAFKEAMAKGGVGSLYGVLRADPWTGVTLETGLTPREGAEVTNLIQKYAIEQTRLGIPILFGEECSHGHMAIGSTVFPVPIGMGSTWNVELFEQMCRAVAVETRAQGGAATYSPVLDVVRDPRWGRTEETFGEDPYLISEMGVAAVRGLQGDTLNSDESIIATLKHFVGYGASEGGRNAAPAHLGPRELKEKDLLPFERAVAAGARSIMTAYNEIDGVPCTSNQELLTHVLREQWGFEGFVITDCGAINMLHHGHQVAESEEDAACLAIRAGVDMEMSGDNFGKYLQLAVEHGKLSVSDIDKAVCRVLRMKFELGLFERPYVDPGHAENTIGKAEHVELARTAAREGVVLLKNSNHTLPLSRSLGRIAVVGPNANNIYNQLGDYTSPQQRQQIVTVLDGVQQKCAGFSEVSYAPGCRIKDPSTEGFQTAMQYAAAADMIIAVVGGSSARDFGEGTIDLKTGAAVITDQSVLSDMDCGEGFDRAELGLSGVQLELLKELRTLGKPLVVVYMNGRPIIEPWVDEHADAILEAWYPGQEGGHAIADILFGDYNPSGRLTLSIPKHVGQLPIAYNMKRTKGKRYVETDLNPQYPFGYGLSYTSFQYDNLRLEQSKIACHESTIVSVDVTNTGSMAGQEVVQLYVSDVASSVTRPAKELKGFCKIDLQPGETKTAQFTIGDQELQFVGPNLEWTVEPGEFHIMIGRHAEDLLQTSLNVVSK